MSFCTTESGEASSAPMNIGAKLISETKPGRTIGKSDNWRLGGETRHAELPARAPGLGLLEITARVLQAEEQIPPAVCWADCWLAEHGD